MVSGVILKKKKKKNGAHSGVLTIISVYSNKSSIIKIFKLCSHYSLVLVPASRNAVYHLSKSCCLTPHLLLQQLLSGSLLQREGDTTGIEDIIAQL